MRVVTAWSRWTLRRLRVGREPKYFVRVCDSGAEALKLIQDAQLETWPSNAVENAIKWLLDEDHKNSVYEACIQNLFDVGIAMALVAATINSSQYDSSKRSKYLTKIREAAPTKSANKKNEDPSDAFASGKRIAFIFPRSAWTQGEHRFTPQNNLAFSPADDRHYDVSVSDPTAIAEDLLRAIRDRTAIWGFFDKHDFRAQAAIVLSNCLARYGAVEAERPPTGWFESPNLSATEQIIRLRFLAGEFGRLTKP